MWCLALFVLNGQNYSRRFPLTLSPPGGRPPETSTCSPISGEWVLVSDGRPPGGENISGNRLCTRVMYTPRTAHERCVIGQTDIFFAPCRCAGRLHHAALNGHRPCASFLLHNWWMSAGAGGIVEVGTEEDERLHSSSSSRGSSRGSSSSSRGSSSLASRRVAEEEDRFGSRPFHFATMSGHVGVSDAGS